MVLAVAGVCFQVVLWPHASQGHQLLLLQTPTAWLDRHQAPIQLPLHMEQEIMRRDTRYVHHSSTRDGHRDTGVTSAINLPPPLYYCKLKPLR